MAVYTLVVTRFQEELLAKAVAEADADGYRLEVVGGLGIWEFQPNLRHYKVSRKVASSVRKFQSGSGESCDCFVAEDIYIRFPDGSLKRPDVSIFCREPDEQDEAVTLIPEAVVEIVSKGSEVKDFELNPDFYLRFGIKDVLIVDPYANVAVHHTRESRVRMNTPAEVTLTCGCALSI